MKRIILTGGGTAGHVTPNIALIPELKREGFDIHYIGSVDGIEKKLIEELNIPYYGISSGKLRRYFDPKNFSDPFRVIKGFAQASSIIKELKPNIVFSKGGFVTVPVVIAAKRNKVPSIIHESDMTPGLANRLCISSASNICCNFPETLEHLPKEKALLTGTPIRKELFTGNKLRGLKLCNFSIEKPVILVIGGSMGSVAINQAVRECLTEITKSYQVIHICGKDKIDNLLLNTPSYIQFEYVKKELSDLLDCADVVISRAGANAICELLALRKPNILIPLSARASRGDQILNGDSFKKQGYSYVINEDDLTNESLLSAINEVYNNRKTYIDTMSKSTLNDSIDTIIGLIKSTAKNIV